MNDNKLHGYIKHRFIILHQVIYDAYYNKFTEEECAVNPDLISCVVPARVCVTPNSNALMGSKCYFMNRETCIQVYEKFYDILELLDKCKKQNSDTN